MNAAAVAVSVPDGAPAYWADACKHLIKRDRVMKKLIPQHPGACLQSRGDAFVTLARSIVGQQISVKAAQSVWERFERLYPELCGQLSTEEAIQVELDTLGSRQEHIK